jgi:hypothetical protein
MKKEVLSRVEALEKFTNFLQNDKNFVYAKFGDGEFACMNGENGHNCDLHPYSEKLGKSLIDSFLFLNKEFDDVYIADWADDNSTEIRDKLCEENDITPKFVYYDTMLHTVGQLDNYIYKFLALIKHSKRRKVFFGPSRLNGVDDMLNVTTHVEVPVVNAFQYYTEFSNWIEDNVSENDIFIFSAGMMSKVLIRDVRRINNHTTCIDMGSSFDPIFFRQTRLKQIPTNELRNFYRDLL